MTTINIRTISGIAVLLALSAVLAGCPCPTCPAPVQCGDGTMEEMINGERICTVVSLACGSGTVETAIDGKKVCVVDDAGGPLSCGEGTHLQEQAVGGERECVPGESPSCPSGYVTVIDGDVECAIAPVACGPGTFEQAVGGERECIMDPKDCGSGTLEQAVGGERECQPTP
jgi:hypothetical protein